MVLSMPYKRKGPMKNKQLPMYSVQVKKFSYYYGEDFENVKRKSTLRGDIEYILQPMYIIYFMEYINGRK